MKKLQIIVTALEVAARGAGAVLGPRRGSLRRSDGSRKKQIFGSGVELLKNLVYLLPVSSKEVLHYTLVLGRGEHISAVAIAASSSSPTRKRCVCC